MLTSAKFTLVFLIWIIKDSTQIQNVRLVLPSVVQAGTSATLLCLYDLEGASLYSVQWYRGQFEFFRFVPKETPPIKVFHIPGIHVDTFATGDHQVTLTNIPVQISGKFSCEITTDDPPFSTSCVSDNLTVIDFSINLYVPKKQYRFGDVIEANCTLIPQLPSAQLIFHWNAERISNKFIKNELLCLNTTVYYMGQPYPVLVQLRCLAVSNDLQHSISTAISLKLKPIHSTESRTTESSTSYFILFSFIFIFLLLLY